MGIAKTVLEQEPKSKLVLVYGNKTPKDTIFYNDLLELSSRYEDRFQLKMVFSQTKEDNALFGRIERGTVNYILNKITDKVDVVYLCGPELMIQQVTETLLSKGLSKEDIKYELFTPYKGVRRNRKRDCR